MMPHAATSHAKGVAFRPTESANNLLKLFSVTVTHNYYTLNHSLCRDFSVSPTPTTASLMASLGIMLRKDEAGFTVFIPAARWPELLKCIRRNATADDHRSGFWSRLTFSLRLVNPLFVGITALPLDTKTSQVNLYVCNTEAHVDESASVVLAPGLYLGGNSLYPVVGSELSMTLPPESRRITVTDISGTVVLDYEIKVAKDPPDPTVRQVVLVLASLPYDLYTIAVLDTDGRPIEDSEYPRTVLYVAPDDESMVLLDLLFTRPTEESSGIYPVPALFGDASDAGAADAGNVAYRLPFDARSTYWQYYVVSQDSRGALTDLTIEGAGTEFRQDPKPVALPDGSTAVLFTGETALPLRQKSPQHFQLQGQRGAALGQDNTLLINRLPVAASSPVWPAADNEVTSGMSEIFVYV